MKHTITINLPDEMDSPENSFFGRAIKSVTLDGELVEHVYAYSITDGWVEAYPASPDGSYKVRYTPERRHGQVAVQWDDAKALVVHNEEATRRTKDAELEALLLDLRRLSSEQRRAREQTYRDEYSHVRREVDEELARPSWKRWLAERAAAATLFIIVTAIVAWCLS